MLQNWDQFASYRFWQTPFFSILTKIQWVCFAECSAILDRIFAHWRLNKKMDLLQSTLILGLECLIRTDPILHLRLGLDLALKHSWFLDRTGLILGHLYVVLCRDDLLSFFAYVSSLILDQYSVLELWPQVSIS